MSTFARAIAEGNQRDASDPAVSAWVGASAGSGKTRVLTDRVLRLLLDPHQRPSGLLCLTFTKAAAAEMATRLARDLGGWAVEDDDTLDARIAALTGAAPDATLRRHARSLFARVLDLPGGMRISTIHAFCQSLLRGFPLEAGLAPHFTVAEEREAATLLAESREHVLAAAGNAGAMEALAGLTPPSAFAELIKALNNNRTKLDAALGASRDSAPLLARVARYLGLAPDQADSALLADAVARTPNLAPTAAALGRSSNANDQSRAARMATWLARDDAARMAHWPDWTAIFLTATQTAYADRNLATKTGLGAHHPAVLAPMREEADRLAGIEERRRALRLLEATGALLALAAPVLKDYAARKSGRGMLDYDDLIFRARAVLENPGSAWVLFKLDGGLDHVLLDEAQDSNAAQWGIAAALTEEFFAGLGARPRPRSIFAVGDVKQSIYGFQGADPEGFFRERVRFRAAVEAAGQPFREIPLTVSFRSTEPVLRLVDAVFANPAAQAGVVTEGEMLRHIADRAGQAGHVELWPAEQSEGDDLPEPWLVPATPVAASGTPDARLAERIAEEIHRWIVQRERLPARDRPIRPGDILILLRKRSGAFIPTLTRALKERRVPVSGLDRLVLIEQIAVQDLLALADALLLPDDDLQLAAALKSPVFGLSEDALFALAHGRSGSLAAALASHRAAQSPLGRAADLFATLAARADYTGPHTLFAELLGEHRGRQNLLARLGPDAADAIDEFLGAALNHERSHPPSLQLFVQWLRAGGASIKRESDAAADQVRIMTVHNAKGLQAPIVILPDTIGPGATDRGVRWAEDRDGTPLPLWAPSQEFHTPPYRALLDAEKAEAARESHRLLYVALTRAEDRLLIAGWQSQKSRPEGCWYDLIADGFTRLPETTTTADGRMVHRTTQSAPPRPEPATTAIPPAPLPDWVARPAPAEESMVTLSPSALPGEEETPAANPRPSDDPRGARFRRGRLVHALLQYLPELPPEAWEGAAARYLARQPGPPPADIGAEVLALLRDPAIAPVFAPGSLAEAPLAGRIRNRLIAGQMDRILVTPERILILDYKTNRPPPEAPEQVPALYLRQMAAYRALLRQAYPGRVVDCALIWTYGARLMALPSAMLDLHEP